MRALAGRYLWVRLSLYGNGRDSPEIAALSMSGSSVIVAVNALLLRRVRLAPRNDAVPSSTSANAAA